jgi:hypothetical protein
MAVESRRRRIIMVIKWFPAAVAAVFIGPALAVAQAPGVPTVETPGVTTSLNVETPQVPDAAPAPSPTAVAVPNIPAADPPAPPPPVAHTGREVALMGMVIVPDRSDRPVIQSVEAGSPAARAGLREDDLIEGLGRQATPTMQEILNFAIPFIRDLDPGTKLTWHVNRDGRDIAVPISRPTDRELGPPSDVEQRVIERQSGSLGYYSSDVPAPPRRERPKHERRRVGDMVYGNRQFSWWYDGDDMPGYVIQEVQRTLQRQVGPNQDFQYYWWSNGDDDPPQAVTQWMQKAGAAQAGSRHPNLEYNWWYDGGE